jgi:hypothetical protein
MDPATTGADVAVVWHSYVFVFQYIDSANYTETGQFQPNETEMHLKKN